MSEKSVLYVTTPGACVRQTHGRLRVTREGKVLQEARLVDIERVVVFGGTAGITSPAAACLMDAGIETAFFSSHGEFRGYLSPARTRGASLRLAQLAAYLDPERRIRLARAIVVQKIRNADSLLARFSRNHPEVDMADERSRLGDALHAAQRAESVSTLMGYEGAAAAAYFAAFGRMLRRGFTFTVRSRRPPRDPANALLSFGYTLLSAEATNAVAGAGLDPTLGMLHALDAGRPSLGLDVAEEFRHPVVDRLVLHLTNNRILSPERDFEDAGAAGAFRMTDDARRLFLTAFEERMTAELPWGEPGTQLSLRDRLRLQASRLARAIREDVVYAPFAFR